jgi:hypothetical protein
MWEGVGRVVRELQLEARTAASLGAETSRSAIAGVGRGQVVEGGVLAYGRRRRILLLLLLLLLPLLLREGALVVGGGRALRQSRRPAQLVLGRSLLDAQRGPGGHRRRGSDCAMPQDVAG